MSTPEIVKMPTKEIKLLVRRLQLRGAGIRIDLDVATLKLGPKHLGAAPMAIHPDPIRADSVVYSFGVGTDVSWDKEMIRRFDVTLHAFDPSPGSVEWVAATDVPDQFIFHPIGLAAYDGELKLYPPRTTRTVHYSSINRTGRISDEGCVRVPVRRLRTIAKELGHDHVDVLKIDIDGSEYDAMPDVLESGIPIGQIMLEVHHNFPTLKFDDTRKLVASLRAHGFRIFYISRRGREFSFLNRSYAAAVQNP